MPEPISRYDVVLFDLDGTLHLGGEPFPDVVDLLGQIARRGVKLVALTNNTSLTPEDYKAKLVGMGLSPDAFELCSPLHVVAALAPAHLRERCFVIGTEAVRGWLAGAGFQQSDADPAAVLVTFDTELDYAKLRAASLAVQAGADLFSTHCDLRCPTQSGFIPDCGAITQMVLTVTGGALAQDFGKPSDAMATYLTQRYLGPGVRGALVGDRVYTDMALAKRMGLEPVLVLTGEAKAETLSPAEAGRLTVRDSFAAFLREAFDV